MPKTEGDIAQLFENRIRPAEVAFCLIEKVHAIPSERVINGKPVKGISSVASFTFGRNVGVLTGLLLAHKVPFQEMDKRTWQKALGIPQRIKNPQKPNPMNSVSTRGSL